jgi:hypothetical protein
VATEIASEEVVSEQVSSGDVAQESDLNIFDCNVIDDLIIQLMVIDISTKKALNILTSMKGQVVEDIKQDSTEGYDDSSVTNGNISPELEVGQEILTAQTEL